jgi:Zn-dependent M28 family amino/carboxypeptidase/pimeloyl-ACP methyl ester carboxylesterase
MNHSIEMSAFHMLRSPGNLIQAGIVLLAWTAVGAAAENGPSFRFSEPRGPHAVGLKVVEQYDYSRTYRHLTDELGKPYRGERARPLQTLIWYPARPNTAHPMTVRDYADLWSTETTFGRPALTTQANEWIAAMKPVLGTSLWAVRDAQEIAQRFPLVIYAPSFSLMSWENADLCEYLASHGYVVIASPSLGATTRNMTLDVAGIEAQARDISFLISYARALANTDLEKIAVAGFSWGGLANLFAAARDNRIDALVSLDGSLRYYPSLVAQAGYVHPERMSIPLLYFAQGELTLEDQERYLKLNGSPSVLNAWTHGDLVMVRMLGMTHQEHSSMYQRNEDVWRNFFPVWRKADYGREEGAIGYAWIARYTLQFLDAYLKHDAAAITFLKRPPAENGVPQHFMSVSYRAALGPPPSFESFRAAIGREGFSHANQIHLRMQKETPGLTLDEGIVNAWATELTDEEKLPEAVAILELNTSMHPESADAYARLAEAYRRSGQNRPALENYRKAVEKGLNDPQVEARFKALASAAAESTLPKTEFETAKISEHTRILASDEFEGRAPASVGEAKTLVYLSDQFKALSLEPAGDAGQWTQKVPLRKFELTQPARVTLKVDGSASELKSGDEVVVTTLAGNGIVEIKDAPLVFVGYGVNAPEVGWDDFKNADLKGKIAVFLINDPDFETPVPGKFNGKAMTWYGRSVYKFNEAARRGAVAALIVHEDAPAAINWVTVQNSWGSTQLDIVRDDPLHYFPLMEGWLRQDLALRLFERAGLDFAALKRLAATPAFAPQSLKGLTLSIAAQVHSETVLSHNVIGRIKGARYPDESVIYSAHWDHLGVGPPDSTGDRIYHGAVDNAIGVAGLLELARVFASKPRPERSIYFVAFTGEEKGLLGSQHFALHPPMSLERTAAIFNMDIFGTDGPARDVAVRGIPNSSLYDMLATVVQSQGRVMSPDAHLEAGYFYRTDHLPLARLGVPALSILSGQDLYRGGATAGEHAYQDYFAHRYHQPADRWSPDWDLRGMALDLEALYQTGRKAADSHTWPQWYVGSEFKRIRDQSATARGSAAAE